MQRFYKNITEYQYTPAAVDHYLVVPDWPTNIRYFLPSSVNSSPKASDAREKTNGRNTAKPPQPASFLTTSSRSQHHLQCHKSSIQRDD